MGERRRLEKKVFFFGHLRSPSFNLIRRKTYDTIHL